MAVFQLVACQINVGGDRNSVIHRDRFEPLTYPEYLLMQVIHGGEEHVHHAMDCGEVERDMAAEYQRLEDTYGIDRVGQLFQGSLRQLPLANQAMQTFEEFEAGEAAAKGAKAKVRAKQSRPTMAFPEGADAVAPGP